MSAPKRTKQQSILAALRAHNGIKGELDLLENAANRQMRKTFPRFSYNGEVSATLREDLAAVVSSRDWRPALERRADGLRRSAKYIRKAVRLAVRAANSCPTHATIPAIAWEFTPEAKAERQRIAALPAGDRLFGKGGAIESLIERQARTVIDPRRAAPDFLKAMLVYAASLDREAERIGGILKARDRRYDRLGPILTLIRDVQGLTGKPNDAVVARLLADASEIAGITEQVSPDAIRKIREHHLAP